MEDNICQACGKTDVPLVKVQNHTITVCGYCGSAHILELGLFVQFRRDIDNDLFHVASAMSALFTSFVGGNINNGMT